MVKDTILIKRVTEYAPIPLNENACALLLQYVKLIENYRDVGRLTSIRRTTDLIDFLITESLQLAKFLPSAGNFTLADLGAGSGAVGISLGIAIPNLTVSLFERSVRKIGFLRLAVTALTLKNVKIEERDVRSIKKGEYSFDFIASRAFAPFTEYLEVALKLVKPSGCILGFTPRGGLDDASIEKFSENKMEVDLLKYHLPNDKRGGVYSIRFKGAVDICRQ